MLLTRDTNTKGNSINKDAVELQILSANKKIADLSRQLSLLQKPEPSNQRIRKASLKTNLRIVAKSKINIV